MPVAVCHAPEISTISTPRSAERTVLVNVELGDACALTNHCGNACFLHHSHAAAGPSLSPESLVEGALEFFEGGMGGTVRHMGIVAKEPLEYGASIRTLARTFHETAPEVRPGSLGVLTASVAGLKAQAPDWRDSPLSWLVISADPADTGLHPGKASEPLMAAAIRAKECGGVGLLGCNTTIRLGQLEKGLEVGRRAAQLGFDQWSLGGLYQLASGTMADTVTHAETEMMMAAVVAEFGSSSSFEVAINVSPERYVSLFGGFEACSDDFKRWRLERWIAPKVCVVSANPRPGHFLRLRWDGQLLNYQDIMNFGTRNGHYGQYQPGELLRLLERFKQERRLSWRLAA